jgi:hypothetical protein
VNWNDPLPEIDEIFGRSSMSKPILCLDFDGVCHSYTSGWISADIIPDDAVPGLFEFLEQAAPFFDIQVYSARSNKRGGIKAMQKWFEKQHRKWLAEQGKESQALPISFPKSKPSSFVSLDDRAITFTGHWPKVEVLRKFQPWHKVARNH